MPVIAASSATFAGRRCDKGCSHTLVALLSPGMRPSEEPGRSRDNKLDGISNALGWRLGRSKSACLLRERVETKEELLPLRSKPH
jgi:hypothetical protein